MSLYFLRNIKCSKQLKSKNVAELDQTTSKKSKANKVDKLDKVNELKSILKKELGWRKANSHPIFKFPGDEVENALKTVENNTQAI